MGRLVSVIMLTYNRERFLGEAIRSVLAQTWREIELIIIDDGSTDNSRRVIDTFSDLRIRYVYQDHSGHASRLRNLGITLARGEWIAFIDSDDIWDKEKLEWQMSHILRGEAPSFSFTYFKTIDSAGRILSHAHPYGGVVPETLFAALVTGKAYIYPSTIVFSKSCIEKTGMFHEGFPWTDNEFIQRLAYHFPAHIVSRSLVSITRHETNVSKKLSFLIGTVAEMEFAATRFYTQKAIDKDTFRICMAQCHFHRGKSLLLQRKGMAASRAFMRSIRYRPFSPRTWYMAAVSLVFPLLNEPIGYALIPGEKQVLWS